ncbi:MAG: hypothetical protein HYS68_00305 [Candidatus Levybacteria bacterium]|nr:hypothetical protein [Candidatus Levybacteria bacterium]
MDLEKLTQALSNLDKKIEELDQQIINIRIEIHNLFWDLVNLRKKIPEPLKKGIPFGFLRGKLAAV